MLPGIQKRYKLDLDSHSHKDKIISKWNRKIVKRCNNLYKFYVSHKGIPFYW